LGNSWSTASNNAQGQYVLIQVRSNSTRQGGNHTWHGETWDRTVRWYFVASPFKFTRHHELAFHEDAVCRTCETDCSPWGSCAGYVATPDFVMTNDIQKAPAGFPSDDATKAETSYPGDAQFQVPIQAAWPISTMQYQWVGDWSVGAVPTYGHPGGGFYLIPYTNLEPDLSSVTKLEIDPGASRSNPHSWDQLYPAWVQETFPQGDWVSTHLPGEPSFLPFYGQFEMSIAKSCWYTCDGSEPLELTGRFKAVTYAYNPYGQAGIKLSTSWSMLVSTSSVSMTWANALAQWSSCCLTCLSIFSYLFPEQMSVPRFFRFGKVPGVHTALYEELYWERRAIP